MHLVAGGVRHGVHLLRDRVGPAMGILFDVGQEYRHGGIVRLARALEPVAAPSLSPT